MSMAQRIGSMIAAAWVGGSTSAISGTVMMPSPPPNPPLEMPETITAGTAAA